MEYLGLIASVAMGITLGLLGGGGSILTVPILVYLFSISPLVATGYSLFVVGITAVLGSLMYLRKGEVDFQVGVLFALPSILGVYISRGVVIPHLPNVIAHLGGFTLTKEVLVMTTFATLMVLASYSMIRRSAERKPVAAPPLTRAALVALQGLVVGVVAGFVGAGGGFLIIPALVFMAGLPMRNAVGTSLMIIAVQSLFGVLGDIARGMNMDWLLLGKIAAAAALGIVIGSSFANKVKEQKLKSAFGGFVLLMGLTVLLEQLRHLSSQ